MKGLKKRLKAQERKIDKLGNNLKSALDNNSSVKRRSNLRTNLSIECEELDRIKRAIEIIGGK